LALASAPAVAAVVVTFYPDEGLAARLSAIRAQCSLVIVVDNGSDAASRARIPVEGVELIAWGENRGLAVALNAGLARAIERGFCWAVTFDQDSTPFPGMVEALWATRHNFAEPERVAVVGPRLREEKLSHVERRWVVPHPRCRWGFSRVECDGGADLAGVAFVITSGALTDLRVYREIGPMDDALFIDYIDHEYCLRARRSGYEVLVSADAWLVHNFGAQREYRVAGRVVRPTFHSALRLRYIARNRWRVWRRHAWAVPHWAAFDAVSCLHVFVRVMLLEDARWAKFCGMVRGTWDGLRGRTGKIDI
jgi:rhamnosyltransferase